MTVDPRFRLRRGAYSLGWDIGCTSLFIEQEVSGAWRIKESFASGLQDWLTSNQLDRQSFATLRDAYQAALAHLSVDEPALPVVYQPLRRVGTGRYQTGGHEICRADRGWQITNPDGITWQAATLHDARVQIYERLAAAAAEREDDHAVTHRVLESSLS